MGVASGLHFLMSTSGTNRERFDDGEVPVDEKMSEKADEFWRNFASGSDLKTGDPILELRNYLPRIDTGGSKGRDEVISIIVKAFNIWVDGKKVKRGGLKIKKKRQDGENVPAEFPRLGGLDTLVD